MTIGFNFKTKPANPASKPREPISKVHAATADASTSKPKQSVFDQLPDSAYLRVSQLVQSPKRPDSTAPLPFSEPTLWRKVKNGSFPKPHRLGTRITAWKVGQVREWMQAQANANA